MNTTWAPMLGRPHVGYLPTNKVVGISNLARVYSGTLVEADTSRVIVHLRQDFSAQRLDGSIENTGGNAVSHPCSIIGDWLTCGISYLRSQLVPITVDQRPELEGWLLVALLAADANRLRPNSRTAALQVLATPIQTANHR